MKKKITLFFIAFLWFLNLNAQDTSKFFVVSGVGVINGQGIFGKSIKPSLGFNSGLELSFKRNLFGQVLVDFNSLNYSQQQTDARSPLLFQNTSATFISLSANIGYNFKSDKTKWFGSLYVGAGYLNTGEPRVVLSSPSVVVQSTVRQSSILGRTGFRVGYKTSSDFFQTLYFDASYWRSSATIQGGKVQGISILVGTRIVV